VPFDKSNTDIMRAFQAWGLLCPLSEFLILILIGSPILGKAQHSKLMKKDGFPYYPTP
jgi:hypothetical protein